MEMLYQSEMFSDIKLMKLLKLMPFVVNVLSKMWVSILSRLHANLTTGFGIMGPKEFFPLLDFAFMPKNALSSR